MTLWLRNAGAALLAVALLSTPTAARADHPALVFGASMMLSAGMALAGSIVAAAILITADVSDDCDCPETETRGENNEEGGPQGSGDGAGTEGGDPAGTGSNPLSGNSGNAGSVFESRNVTLQGPGSTRFDDSGTHPRVTGFIDRSGAMSIEPSSDGRTRMSASYQFDGNIARAPNSVSAFRHGEAVAFKLQLDSKKIADPQACVNLVLEQLRLTTEDIAGTNGSTELSIDIFEEGKQTRSHQLLVRQGQVTTRPQWLTKGEFKKDGAQLRGATLAIPCTPHRDGRPLNLTVAFNMRMVGERI